MTSVASSASRNFFLRCHWGGGAYASAAGAASGCPVALAVMVAPARVLILTPDRRRSCEAAVGNFTRKSLFPRHAGAERSERQRVERRPGSFAEVAHLDPGRRLLVE